MSKNSCLFCIVLFLIGCTVPEGMRGVYENDIQAIELTESGVVLNGLFNGQSGRVYTDSYRFLVSLPKENNVLFCASKTSCVGFLNIEFVNERTSYGYTFKKYVADIVTMRMNGKHIEGSLMVGMEFELQDLGQSYWIWYLGASIVSPFEVYRVLSNG